jgi:hypothetical protein
MFLSTSEHTIHSLSFHHRYNSFFALRKVCEDFQYQADLFSGARALLDEFQQRVLPEALGDLQQDIISLSIEEAVVCLLGAAIECFGYFARDVFNATFHYDLVTDRHRICEIRSCRFRPHG